MTTNKMEYRTHRVGTITAGVAMVVFGVLLLLHSVFDFMAYETIFAFWPVILIGLGMDTEWMNSIDGILTSIDTPAEEESKEGACYDLNGRPVKKAKRGIFIKKGRKYFVK